MYINIIPKYKINIHSGKVILYLKSIIKLYNKSGKQ
nr:MAG TPA: hypothetical protein [Bacteriophage sp.]DAO05752.1 MAG TPA: hypothetical protein [Bacteriophage sp.]